MKFFKFLRTAAFCAGFLVASMQAMGQEVTTLFAHGLGGGSNHGEHCRYNHRSGKGFIEGALEVFDFEDSSAHPRWKKKPSCLAQEGDMRCLQGAYHAIASEGRPVILAGVSRGAATILNFMGTAPAQDVRQVRALVLESPFDKLKSILEYKFGFIGEMPGIEYAAKRIALGGYNPNGIQPIQVVDKISKDIPILLICSKQDGLIPSSSTINLYRKIVESGHTRAHLLELERGPHANLPWGENGGIYRNVVHAFYRHYNLPYNREAALAGQEQFARTQPTLDAPHIQPKITRPLLTRARAWVRNNASTLAVIGAVVVACKYRKELSTLAYKCKNQLSAALSKNNLRGLLNWTRTSVRTL